MHNALYLMAIVGFPGIIKHFKMVMVLKDKSFWFTQVFHIHVYFGHM